MASQHRPDALKIIADNNDYPFMESQQRALKPDDRNVSVPNNMLIRKNDMASWQSLWFSIIQLGIAYNAPKFVSFSSNSLVFRQPQMKTITLQWRTICAFVSWITGNWIIRSTACFGEQERKLKSSALLSICWVFTGDNECEKHFCVMTLSQNATFYLPLNVSTCMCIAPALTQITLL